MEDNKVRKNIPVVLILAKSGAGKDYIADHFFGKLGMQKLKSYTTRPKRGKYDDTHIFITKEEFLALQDDMVAMTVYNGELYGATNKQLDECGLYILDLPGLIYLKEHYSNRPLVSLYFKVSPWTRYRRMRQRGDSVKSALKRLWFDRMAFKGVEDHVDFVIGG